MPYTQPHQYTLMPNMLQMRHGQSRLMTTFREFQNAKYTVFLSGRNSNCNLFLQHDFESNILVAALPTQKQSFLV